MEHNIDLSVLKDMLTTVIQFMQNFNFKIGEFNFNLWQCIVALGTLEALTLLFKIKFGADKKVKEEE